MRILSAILITMISFQVSAAIVCTGEDNNGRQIRVVAASLKFDDSLTPRVPAITVIEGRGIDRKVTYHQTMEERLPSPNFPLVHEMYDNFYVSEDSFHKEPTNVKAFIGQNSNFVELICPNQSKEIKSIFFNH
ncbi:hypothetical protein OAT67_09760 [Bacteriovoracaceae bacterium]|nr:hypothetical protein [Bacteriovoracaceae bacterium]